MSKYDPLKQYLESRRFEEVPMTFSEIERVLGFKLPEKSQQHRAWWSNNASNSVMTKAWLAAGYKTERVDLAARRLVFRRAAHVRNQPKAFKSASELRPPRSSGRNNGTTHPLFGVLAGLGKTAPGVDLTEPVDPDWGRAND